MKTVIYHSADFDGIFCREIAKTFLGEKDVQYIGWNFGDPPIDLPINGEFVIMDLPIDKPFGLGFKDGWLVRGSEKLQPLDRVDWEKFIWIDHHKSSIESHPTGIPGYRIDGVAACRLAWQWFQYHSNITNMPGLPAKESFIDRTVAEPLAVRLAGEYDIWDKRDPEAETFQYALRVIDGDAFPGLLGGNSYYWVEKIMPMGRSARKYAERVNANIANHLTWLMKWEGLTFLCVNHARFNSSLFASKDVPQNGHDALLGFRFDGKTWMVSLYHAAHRKDLDLSQIAVKHGGGGHRGACGFTCDKLPFMP